MKITTRSFGWLFCVYAALGAPSRGAGAKRLRGRRSNEQSMVQKKERTINSIVGDGLRAVPLSTVLHCKKNRRAMPKYPLSFRDQFANWSWESESPMHRAKTYCRLKDNGFPRRFAPRNDRGGSIHCLVFYLLAIIQDWRPPVPLGGEPRMGGSALRAQRWTRRLATTSKKHPTAIAHTRKKSTH